MRRFARARRSSSKASATLSTANILSKACPTASTGAQAAAGRHCCASFVKTEAYSFCPRLVTKCLSRFSTVMSIALLSSDRCGIRRTLPKHHRAGNGFSRALTRGGRHESIASATPSRRWSHVEGMNITDGLWKFLPCALSTSNSQFGMVLSRVATDDLSPPGRRAHDPASPGLTSVFAGDRANIRRTRQALGLRRDELLLYKAAFAGSPPAYAHLACHSSIGPRCRSRHL